MKVFGITGWKNAGKTTLTVKLVTHFVSRGFRVGTIKRAHCGFDVDQPGTDSFKHRQAGAQGVIVSSSKRWAMINELAEDEAEMPLVALLAQFEHNKDLVLVEGYKQEPHPKLQAVRPAVCDRPMNGEKGKNIIALASDAPLQASDYRCEGPVFDLDDIDGIAAFIRQYLDLPEHIAS